MADYLLTQIINYGAPLFGLILFLGALGIPIPASILLIAAGCRPRPVVPVIFWADVVLTRLSTRPAFLAKSKWPLFRTATPAES